MTYMPITPFRRAVDDAVLEHQHYHRTDASSQGISKWKVLRELSVARKQFGLSDREMTVLQALLSFHPETELKTEGKPLVVFPSNAAICERLNGMACSTMRRQLSRLVQSGFVIRRDSPNGKRYTRRFGEERVSFGFDLTPLVTRYQEVCRVAAEERTKEEAYQRLRQTVSLMRRDLKGLSDYARSLHPDLNVWDECDDLWALVSRDLKRRLSMDDLSLWETKLTDILNRVRDLLETDEMSTSDVRYEHHHQSSNIEYQDSEPCLEMGAEAVDTQADSLVPATAPKENQEGKLPNIPLSLVLVTCLEFQTYLPDRVKNWHQLVVAADRIRPMIGISSSAWDEAVEAMGPEQAAIVLLAMLERLSEIRSPAGYLRSLARKASVGQFSCGPMVMALTRRSA